LTDWLISTRVFGKKIREMYCGENPPKYYSSVGYSLASGKIKGLRERSSSTYADFISSKCGTTARPCAPPLVSTWTSRQTTTITRRRYSPWFATTGGFSTILSVSSGERTYWRRTSNLEGLLSGNWKEISTIVTCRDASVYDNGGAGIPAEEFLRIPVRLSASEKLVIHGSTCGGRSLERKALLQKVNTVPVNFSCSDKISNVTQILSQ